jgi:hypothetical protein
MSTDLSVHWDYYDQVWRYGRVYDRDAMLRLCRDAKAAGVRSLNFRVEGAGMSWVPTKSRAVFDRYEPGRCLDFADFSRVPDSAVKHDQRVFVADLFKQTYEQVGDPLAVACEVAREVGLKLNIYICPLDQYWPGVPDSIVEKHPERCIVSRDGKHRLAVPSLAYEENRRWLLDYYREIFEHDFADVIVYSGSHAWYSYPLDVPDDWFGFEERAVTDYRDKTGVDVLKDPFDVDDYYRHYGTYWTALLKELSAMQRKRGHRLIVGMDMGPWQIHLPARCGGPRCSWRVENDWRTWTSWGNVDLCVGHQVNMWKYEGWPGNQLPYMPGEPGRPPCEFIDELFGDSASRDFSLWSFLTLHKNVADAELPMAFEGTRRLGFDGLIIREAMDFEFDLGWDVLKAPVNREA